METASPGPQTPGATRSARLPSCTSCTKRKVKCDRQTPCSGCAKSGRDCVYAAHPPPRRRKRKEEEVDSLREQVKEYEERLKRYDVNGRSPGGPTIGPRDTVALLSTGFSSPSSERPPPGASHTRDEAGVLPIRRERIRPMEQEPKFLGDNLWNGLGDDFQDPRDAIHQTPALTSDRSNKTTPNNLGLDSNSLLFGFSTSIESLTALHPQPVQMFRLWQTFLDNVNPLTKLVHAPTLQHKILEVSSTIENIDISTEALLFAIYASAIASMTDEDCTKVLGESKKVALSKYVTATQQALIRADFLRSPDMTVLQAFVLFLLAIRQHVDPPTHWILTGVAARIGERLGIHRDALSLNHQVSVFEAEMRRRLWWQIVLLDSRSAQLSGSSTTISGSSWDSHVPANLNDSELYPEMRDLPPEHAGATEMVFCLGRYQFGKFLRATGPTGEGNWERLSSSKVSLEEKDAILDEVQELVESQFARYCDQSIPLHWLTIGVGTCAIAKMRLLAHHPRQYPDGGASLPQDRKDLVFRNCLRIIEVDVEGQPIEALRRYSWHTRSYFQLDVFVLLLSELRRRVRDDLTEKAWGLVEAIYHYHTELLEETSNALYWAVGDLTLKAWEAREKDLLQTIGPEHQIPHFVSTLRALRGIDASTSSRIQVSEESNSSVKQMNGLVAGSPAMEGPFSADFRIGDDAELDLSPMDWDYWMNLLQENEIQELGRSGQQLFG